MNPLHFILIIFLIILIYITLRYILSKSSKLTGLINANKRVMKDNYFKAQWYQALADQANFAKNGDIPVPFWAKISAIPQGPVANAVNKNLAGADVQSEANMADQQIEQIIADHAK